MNQSQSNLPLLSTQLELTNMSLLSSTKQKELDNSTPSPDTSSRETDHSDASRSPDPYNGTDQVNFRPIDYSHGPSCLVFEDQTNSSDDGVDDHNSTQRSPQRSQSSLKGHAITPEEKSKIQVKQKSAKKAKGRKNHSANVKRRLKELNEFLDPIHELTEEYHSSQNKKVHSEDSGSLILSQATQGSLHDSSGLIPIVGGPKILVGDEEDHLFDQCYEEGASGKASSTKMDEEDGLKNVLETSYTCTKCLCQIPSQETKNGYVEICRDCTNKELYNHKSGKESTDSKRPKKRGKSKKEEILDEPPKDVVEDESYPDILSAEEFKEKTPVGNKHQASLPAFALNAPEVVPSRKKRVLNIRWNPERINSNDYEKFKEDLRKKHSLHLAETDMTEILANQDYNPAKALRWCTKMNPEFQVYIKKSSSRRRLLMKGFGQN